MDLDLVIARLRADQSTELRKMALTMADEIRQLREAQAQLQAGTSSGTSKKQASATKTGGQDQS